MRQLTQIPSSGFSTRSRSSLETRLRPSRERACRGWSVDCLVSKKKEKGGIGGLATGGSSCDDAARLLLLFLRYLLDSCSARNCSAYHADDAVQKRRISVSDGRARVCVQRRRVSLEPRSRRTARRKKEEKNGKRKQKRRESLKRKNSSFDLLYCKFPENAENAFCLLS